MMITWTPRTRNLGLATLALARKVPYLTSRTPPKQRPNIIVCWVPRPQMCLMIRMALSTFKICLETHKIMKSKWTMIVPQIHRNWAPFWKRTFSSILKSHARSVRKCLEKRSFSRGFRKVWATTLWSAPFASRSSYPNSRSIVKKRIVSWMGDRVQRCLYCLQSPYIKNSSIFWWRRAIKYWWMRISYRIIRLHSGTWSSTLRSLNSRLSCWIWITRRSTSECIALRSKSTSRLRRRWPICLGETIRIPGSRICCHRLWSLTHPIWKSWMKLKTVLSA